MGKVFKKLDVLSPLLTKEEMKEMEKQLPLQFITVTFINFDEEQGVYYFNTSPFSEMDPSFISPISEGALKTLKDNDMFYPLRRGEKPYYHYKVFYRLDRKWEEVYVEKIIMFNKARCKKYRKKMKRDWRPIDKLLRQL